MGFFIEVEINRNISDGLYSVLISRKELNLIVEKEKVLSKSPLENKTLKDFLYCRAYSMPDFMKLVGKQDVIFFEGWSFVFDIISDMDFYSSALFVEYNCFVALEVVMRDTNELFFRELLPGYFVGQLLSSGYFKLSDVVRGEFLQNEKLAVFNTLRKLVETVNIGIYPDEFDLIIKAIPIDEYLITEM